MKTNIKIRCYPSATQEKVLGNYLFSSQLFRNFAVGFLKDRYKKKKLWISQNKKIYEIYSDAIKIYSKKIKSVKKSKFLTEFEREEMLSDLKLVRPKTPDQILDSPTSALSLELTIELLKSKLWFLKNLKLFEVELKPHGIKVPKRQPKSISEFYNNLPLSVRKSLQRSAQNEGVLLYLLQSPRTVFDQIIQDLKKTLSKAHKNIAEGNPVREAGFPKFKKLARYGGVRLQVDSRLTDFTSHWKNQQIFLSELGVINWQDSGYILPETPCKMITLKKDKTGKYFITFFGDISYNEKRVKQKERSLAGKPVIKPAKTLFDFFDGQTAAFDIGRKSGLIQVVSNNEQEIPQSNTPILDTLEKESSLKKYNTEDNTENSNKNYTVQVLSDSDLARMVKKENGKIRYIKYQQKKLSRQDKAKKKNKKRKIRNKNSLHVKGKHSHRHIKTQDKINKTYQGLTNLREFFLRALAQKIVQGKTVIFLEDLDVKSMLKNNNKSKKKDKDTKDQEITKKKKKSGNYHKNDKNSQHRAGFGRFNEILQEECLKNNVLILRCDRYDPTSQLCSSCGFHWGKLDTSVREITCTGCGKTHNRDQNATSNIKFLALYRYLLRETLSEQESGKKNNKNNQLTTNKVVNKPTTQVVRDLLLAERVNGGKTGDYSSFTQISHDEILMYINQNYPIDNVLVAIEQHSKKVISKKEKETPGPETKPCGKAYHPVFSKTERRAS